MRHPAFLATRSEILALATDKCSVQVTHETQSQGAGVYLLYVDDFSDDSVIPVYVGKTNNFQRRYREHLKEVMSLNRLGRDYYRLLLWRGFYAGSYRACKIFKYMVEHDCSLMQLKMVIVATVDESEERGRVERRLIDKYRCSFFGFNQLVSRTETFGAFGGRGHESTEDDYLQRWEALDHDIQGLSEFRGLGFAEINFRLVCPPAVGIPDKLSSSVALKTRAAKVNASLEQLWKLFLGEEERGQEAEREHRERRQHELAALERETAQELEKKRHSFPKKVRRRFKKDGIRSSTAYRQFVESVLAGDEGARVAFQRYCAGRELPLDYYEVFSSDFFYVSGLHMELQRISSEMTTLFDEDCRLQVAKQARIAELLAPLGEYPSLPLKDRYSPYVFEPHDAAVSDFCQINIALSNDGRRKEPEIVKIDYRFVSPNHSVFEETDLFVRCAATATAGTSYQEKDYVHLQPELFPAKFQVRSAWTGQPRELQMDDCWFWNDCFMSVGAEFKTGINDFTFSQLPLEGLTDIVLRIEGLVTLSTRFRIVLSESRSCLRRAIEGLEQNNLDLLVVGKLSKFCVSRKAGLI